VTMPVSGRSLEVTPVLDDELVAIAPSDVQLPKRVTPAALSRMPLVLFEPGGISRQIPDAWFARAGITVKPVMSLGSVEAIKEMVIAGLGCAILPSMAVRNDRDRDLLAIRSLSPKVYRKLAIVMRRDKRLDRGLRETVGAIKALSERGQATAASPPARW
jgi:DNA-binding transcriptional LysR family regulator